MKPTKSFLSIILMSVALFVSTSCSNDDDGPTPQPEPVQICPIMSLTSNTGQDVTIAYNSDGNVKSFVLSDGSNVVESTFTYSGNTIESLVLNNGSFGVKTIITLNENGMAENIRTEYDETGTNWDNQAFEYNGTELSKVIATSDASSSPVESNYTWSDGNMVSIDNEEFFDYYTDEAFRAGDALTLYGFLLYGQHDLIFRNKNLVKSKSEPSGPYTENHEYEFDQEGKILKVTSTDDSGNIDIMSFTYDCE